MLILQVLGIYLAIEVLVVLIAMVFRKRLIRNIRMLLGITHMHANMSALRDAYEHNNTRLNKHRDALIQIRDWVRSRNKSHSTTSQSETTH